MSGQAVHDTYVSLERVERNYRQMKTGPLDVRPLFVRKESRTRGHVFGCVLALKVSRELERRLYAVFKTTGTHPARHHAAHRAHVTHETRARDRRSTRPPELSLTGRRADQVPVR